MPNIEFQEEDYRSFIKRSPVPESQSWWVRFFIRIGLAKNEAQAVIIAVALALLLIGISVFFFLKIEWQPKILDELTSIPQYRQDIYSSFNN